MKRHHHEVEEDAWRMFNAGLWSEALSLFREALDRDPVSEGALQGQAACLRKLTRFDDAQHRLTSALDLYPHSIGLLAEQVWLHVEQKNNADAIASLEKLLNESTTHRDAAEHFSWLVELLRTERRYDEAEQWLGKALAVPAFQTNYSLLINRAWLYFYEDRFGEASEIFHQLLEQHPDDRMAIQGILACLRLRGAYDEAASEAKRAIAKNPNQPGVLSEMAWLSWDQGNYSEASAYFEAVAAITPDDPYAYVNLAAAITRGGDSERLRTAADLCRKALRLDEKLPEARACLGVIAFRQGRMAEAEIQLQKSVESGKYDTGYAELGALYTSIGRYDAAESTLRKGLTVARSDGALHLELGNLYMQIEKSREAMAEYRQAMALDRRNPEPVRGLALALMESGRLGDAEAALRNAIRTLDESRRWKLHVTLCQVLTRVADETGDSDLKAEALKEANTALRLAADESDTHFCCAIARYKMEDYRGALKHFKRCQAMDPARTDAEINMRILKKFLIQEKLRSRRLASFLLAVIILGQLTLLWALRLRYGTAEKTAVVTGTMLTVLVPVCLGLLVVSLLLPSLTKLKLTGMEAELSQQPSKESLASGPKGQIGFGSASFAGGALAGGARPQGS